MNSSNRSLAHRQAADGPPAPTKIVYVSDTPFETDAITVRSPRDLEKLMDDGWTIQSRTRRKVSGVSGAKVVVDYIILEKVMRRTVARRHEDVDDGDSVGTNSRTLTTGSGIGNVGSYLGGGSDFSGMPGIDVRTSKTIDNAFGMGVDCAKTGGTPDMCPFPPGDKFHEQWMRGFTAGGGVAGEEKGKPSQEALDEAYKYGKTSATGPKDLEVSCPYPQGTALYVEWLRGFAENGGQVE